MVKYTISVDGMQCGMCEAHVNDAVRQALPVKKVSSSHIKNQTVVVTQQEVDEQKLKDDTHRTGYTVLSIVKESYEEKGMFSKCKR